MVSGMAKIIMAMKSAFALLRARAYKKKKKKKYGEMALGENISWQYQRLLRASAIRRLSMAAYLAWRRLMVNRERNRSAKILAEAHGANMPYEAYLCCISGLRKNGWRLAYLWLTLPVIRNIERRRKRQK
jgi:hypothetical protein